MKKLLLVLLLIPFIGCARWQNDNAARGGIFGSYTGDYIVRNDSGGKIMDIWKLRNIYYSPTDKLFRDGKGNVVMLGGDIRVTRVYDHDTWDKYYEYHTEFETKTYQELHCK
jgi:hypothetical protein